MEDKVRRADDDNLDSVVEHVGRVCVSVSNKSSAKSTH